VGGELGSGGWIADLICEVGKEKEKVKMDAKKIELVQTWI